MTHSICMVHHYVATKHDRLKSSQNNLDDLTSHNHIQWDFALTAYFNFESVLSSKSEKWNEEWNEIVFFSA